MSEDFQSVWLLDSSYTPLIIFQIADLALTLYHSDQERRGKLWRYFGAIAGVRISDGFGRLVFFGGLTISLWIVGLLGISGTVLWQTPLAFGCLGAIIGCRISDSLFSHVFLNKAGYRPNPGLRSVPLYFVEVLFLVVVFYPALLAHPIAALIGFIVGVAAFYSVIPVLKKFGPLLFPTIERWKPGDPQPKW
jgi:hypothetical protein